MGIAKGTRMTRDAIGSDDWLALAQSRVYASLIDRRVLAAGEMPEGSGDRLNEGLTFSQGELGVGAGR